MNTYARWLFGTAAVFLFLRAIFLRRIGFDPVEGSNIVVADLVGAFVALFGYCFLLVAIDAAKYRPYVSLGAIGKLLAIACVVLPWLTGTTRARPPLLLGGDLIFALLFLDYLRRTRTQEG